MKLNLHKLHLVTCLLENTLFVFKTFFVFNRFAPYQNIFAVALVAKG